MGVLADYNANLSHGVLSPTPFCAELYGKEGFQEMWSAWIDALTKIHSEKNGDLCKSYLEHIKCPTLIVHGQKDPMVPDFHPEFLHKNIKGSRLHLMPEGRHNLHLRYADEFNDLVKKFLKEQL